MYYKYLILFFVQFLDRCFLNFEFNVTFSYYDRSKIFPK